MIANHFYSSAISLIAQFGNNGQNNAANDAGSFSDNMWWIATLAGIVFLGIILLGLVIAFATYGKLWVQAYMSSADVGLLSLVGLSLIHI